MAEGSTEKRITPWLDLVTAVLHAPSSSFPVDAFLQQFYETFGTQASWNWVDPDGSYGFRLWRPIPAWPTPEELYFFAGPHLDSHPLIRWYRTTGDLTPMSITRVPRPMSTRESISLVLERLSHVELDQQLCIPYRASLSQQRNFLLSQTGRDFPDADLAVARRIQPLLALVARQHDVLAGKAPFRPDSGASRLAATFGLTARETAVLKLLIEGLTAHAIGTRLAISPRTAQVHLDHLYRKLGVHDRLMAVRVAGECGLWLPVTGRAGNDDDTAARAGGHDAHDAAVPTRGETLAHPPRDVVGQREAAWIPGVGVVRASAPY
jgi:DNA-binding CsgD family transcriptional regulator